MDQSQLCLFSTSCAMRVCLPQSQICFFCTCIRSLSGKVTGARITKDQSCLLRVEITQGPTLPMLIFKKINTRRELRMRAYHYEEWLLRTTGHGWLPGNCFLDRPDKLTAIVILHTRLTQAQARSNPITELCPTESRGRQ